MEKKNKTLEERVQDLEKNHNKPKFKSFFDNNLSATDPNMLNSLKQKLDLLDRRVKMLEDKLKKVKTNE